jgi:hypothetical protein
VESAIMIPMSRLQVYMRWLRVGPWLCLYPSPGCENLGEGILY